MKKNLIKYHAILFIPIVFFLANYAYLFCYHFSVNMASFNSRLLLGQGSLEAAKQLNSMYTKSSLVLGVFSQYTKITLIYLFACVVLVFLLRKYHSWKSIGADIKIRVVITLVAAIFTYNNAFSSFNLFTNEVYLWDRVLLVVFNLLIFYSPLAFLFYFPVLFLLFSSFAFPLAEYSMVDKLLAIDFLFVSFVVALVEQIRQHFKFTQYHQPQLISFRNLWLISCFVVVASNYFAPFMMKVLISDNPLDWFLVEKFDLALVKYFDAEWNLNFSPELKAYWIDFFSKYGAVFLFFAFLIEFLGLGLFFKKKISITILFIFITLNSGIFLLSSILFWKWIVTNIILAIYLISSEKFTFQKKESWVAIATVVLFSYSFPQSYPRLGWYSNPSLSEYYIEVETTKGTRHKVSGQDMAPFDLYFSYSHNWDLLDQRVIYPYSTDPKETKKLEKMNIKELEAYKQKSGAKRYQERKLKMLKLFLKQYFKNFNQDIHRPTYGPIEHIQLQVKNKFKFDTQVKKVHILCREILYENTKIKKQKVYKIDSVSI